MIKRIIKLNHAQENSIKICIWKVALNYHLNLFVALDCLNFLWNYSVHFLCDWPYLLKCLKIFMCTLVFMFDVPCTLEPTLRKYIFMTWHFHIKMMFLLNEKYFREAISYYKHIHEFTEEEKNDITIVLRSGGLRGWRSTI